MVFKFAMPLSAEKYSLNGSELCIKRSIPK